MYLPILHLPRVALQVAGKIAPCVRALNCMMSIQAIAPECEADLAKAMVSRQLCAIHTLSSRSYNWSLFLRMVLKRRTYIKLGSAPYHTRSIRRAMAILQKTQPNVPV